MRHDVFLYSVILKVAGVLSGLFIIGLLIHWPMPYVLLANIIALVVPSVALYYLVAGGYFITQQHIGETLEGMRG